MPDDTSTLYVMRDYLRSAVTFAHHLGVEPSAELLAVLDRERPVTTDADTERQALAAACFAFEAQIRRSVS